MATLKGLITYYAWGTPSGTTQNVNITSLGLAPGDTLIILSRRRNYSDYPNLPAGWENLLSAEDLDMALTFPYTGMYPEHFFSPYQWVGGAFPSVVSFAQDGYQECLLQFVALTLAPGESIGDSWPLGTADSVNLNDPVDLDENYPSEGSLFVFVSRDGYGLM